MTGAVSAAQNIVKVCAAPAALEVNDLILQPLASSLAVLTEDEKELGVVLVDIGGGTTDIAIYSEGSIRHHRGDPRSRATRSPTTSRWRCARRRPTPRTSRSSNGIAKQALADPDEMIEVPGLGERGPRVLSRQAPRP